MAREQIRWKSSEGVESGVDAIEVIEGDIVFMDIVDNPWPNSTNPKDQLKITLENFEIIELNGDMPNIKEDVFDIYIPYAKAGEEPKKNSFFMKYFLTSAEELGLSMPVTDIRARFRRKTVGFGKDADGERIQTTKYVFDSVCENGHAELSDEYIQQLLVNKKVSVVKRTLMSDPKTKKDKDIINSAKADMDAFLGSVGLVDIDGVVALVDEG